MVAGQEIYSEVIRILQENQNPFLIGGAFALRHHTGITREKDLDLFCKPGEYMKILKLLRKYGFETEITDARWVAKAYKNDFCIDFIFNTANNLCPVDETWFDHSEKGEIFGIPAPFISAEELLWCKIYVQDRHHYDGADINHLILKKGKEMDWKRVAMKLEQHWQLLLAQFLNYQFIYPSERDQVPKWLFDELLELARDQYELPAPVDKVCRGPLVDHTNYETDITKWSYKIITVKNL